jgi:hypothetical protein
MQLKRGERHNSLLLFFICPGELILAGRQLSKRAKKGDGTPQTNQIQARLRQLLEGNLDAIGQGLVQKASEGNYNAVQLLLRLSGVDPDPKFGAVEDDDQQQGRIFFLEMVERMVGQRPEDSHNRDKSHGGAAEAPDLNRRDRNVGSKGNK